MTTAGATPGIPAAPVGAARTAVLPAGAALDQLRAAAAPKLPLPPLDQDTYASAHAAFEARSDQRALLTRWLLERLVSRTATGRPVSVLSVGCGDGAVDVALADALTARDPGRPVRYVGVDPHPASGAAFRARLDALKRPGLAASTITASFDRLGGAAVYDVVLFVHSLYYVPDVGAALARAEALLAPGGEVLVLHAPRAGLNELAATLATPAAGHRQWWAETTERVVAASGLCGASCTIKGRLDLGDCLDETDPVGCSVLDFTVQARLPESLRPLALDALRAVALPGNGLAVEHPLRAWELRRPA